jgi:hypothetical protein
VVIFTDGLENASHEWTHKKLFGRVYALRSKGWTFVFLGANQDSYATGAQRAMPAGNFRADAVGVAAMTDGWQFWGGKKEAETVLGSSDRWQPERTTTHQLTSQHGAGAELEAGHVLAVDRRNQFGKSDAARIGLSSFRPTENVM